MRRQSNDRDGGSAPAAREVPHRDPPPSRADPELLARLRRLEAENANLRAAVGSHKAAARAARAAVEPPQAGAGWFRHSEPAVEPPSGPARRRAWLSLTLWKAGLTWAGLLGLLWLSEHQLNGRQLLERSCPAEICPATTLSAHGRAINVTFEQLGVVRSDGRYNLRPTSGSFLSGQLTAIMGGSGAGKSTLFNVITERVPRGWVPEGAVFISGHDIPLSSVRNLIGVVPQDDIVYEELSVLENLIYSSEWRLEHGTFPAFSRRELVNDVLERLAMREHAPKRVGNNKDFKRGGISGGQKKRVNIGLELVADPNVLFLDEPTSGLDSTTTASVMSSLKATAVDSSIAVAAVIHQPNAKVFHGFDSLMLIAGSQRGGCTIFMGPTRLAVGYFESRGFEYDQAEYGNPADFLMDIVGSVLQPRNGSVDAFMLEEMWQSECAAADGLIQADTATADAPGWFCLPMRQWHIENQQAAARHPDGPARIVEAAMHHNEDAFQLPLFFHRSAKLAFRAIQTKDILIVLAMAVMMGWIRAMLISTLGDNLITGNVVNTVIAVVCSLFCCTNALSLLQTERYNIQREINSSVGLHWYFIAKMLVALAISGAYALIFTVSYVGSCNLLLRSRGWLEYNGVVWKWKDENGVFVNLMRQWVGHRDRDLLKLYYIFWLLFYAAHVSGLLLASFDRYAGLGESTTMLLAIVAILVLASVGTVSSLVAQWFSFIYVFKELVLLLEVGLETTCPENPMSARFEHLYAVVEGMRLRKEERINKLWKEITGGKNKLTNSEATQLVTVFKLPEGTNLMDRYGVADSSGVLHIPLKSPAPTAECSAELSASKGFHRLIAEMGGATSLPYIFINDAVASGVLGLITGIDLLAMYGLSTRDKDQASNWAKQEGSLWAIVLSQAAMALCVLNGSSSWLAEAIHCEDESVTQFLSDGLNQAGLVLLLYVMIHLVLRTYSHKFDNLKILWQKLNERILSRSENGSSSMDEYEQRGEDTALLDVTLSVMDLIRAKLEKVAPIEWQFTDPNSRIEHWASLHDSLTGGKGARQETIARIDNAWKSSQLRPSGSVHGRPIYTVFAECENNSHGRSFDLEGNFLRPGGVELRLQRIAARDKQLEEWQLWVQAKGISVLGILAPYAQQASDIAETVGTLMLDIETKLMERREEFEQESSHSKLAPADIAGQDRASVAIVVLQEAKWRLKVAKAPSVVRCLLLYCLTCVLAPRQEGSVMARDVDLRRLLFTCVQDLIGVGLHRTLEESNARGIQRALVELAEIYAKDFAEDIQHLPELLLRPSITALADMADCIELFTGWELAWDGSQVRVHPEDIAAETAMLWIQPGGRKDQLRMVCRQLEELYKGPYRPAAKLLSVASQLLNCALDVEYTDSAAALVDDLSVSMQAQTDMLRQGLTRLISWVSAVDLTGIRRTRALARCKNLSSESIETPCEQTRPSPQAEARVNIGYAFHDVIENEDDESTDRDFSMLDEDDFVF